MFADRARIIIQSGKGGNGHISFRREKYVPAGGPDGGDGGRGGDIIFEVSDQVNNLSDYRMRRKFAATNGEEGGKKKCHGKDGQDLVLKVPAGTVIKERLLPNAHQLYMPGNNIAHNIPPINQHPALAVLQLKLGAL